MQFALLINDSPEAFAVRKSEGADRYTGARRAYYKALVENGVVAGDPLEVPETGTTERINDGERHAKEQLGGFTMVEPPSLDAAPAWAARCPAASYGAVEVRPLSPELRRRVEK